MNYLAACLFLYLSHVVPSAPGVRGRLVAQMGTGTFRIVYSVVSLGAVIWFVMAYNASETGGLIFSPPAGIVWVALVLVPAAIFLMVSRLMTPFGELATPLPVRGIYRVTRFPGSWGVLAWALVHLAATGDAKRVVAFGTLALIAVTALVKNQRVFKRQLSEEARRFVEATGIIPFEAILARRQHLSLKEMGWKPLLVSILLVGLVLGSHPFLFGVNPLSLLF